MIDHRIQDQMVKITMNRPLEYLFVCITYRLNTVYFLFGANWTKSMHAQAVETYVTHMALCRAHALSKAQKQQRQYTCMKDVI